MKLAFSIYSGAGNSFLFFDNRKGQFCLSWVSRLCEQHKVDGVILVENSLHAHAKMRLLNPDQSEAEMCGNGIRCFIRYLQEIGINEKVYSVETQAGLYTGFLQDECVSIKCPPPLELKWNFFRGGHFLNTGVPHAVVLVEDVEKIDVQTAGKKLRYDPLFGPGGTNVTFLEKQEKKAKIRTYERGVEGETAACGTGAIAAALTCAQWFAFASPIEVEVRSQDVLKIAFTHDWKELFLIGPTVLLGKGTFSINKETRILTAL